MPDRITVDIEAYREKIEKFCEETERTISQAIRFCIKDFFDKREAPHHQAMREAEVELVFNFVKKIANDQKPSTGEIMLLSKLLKESPESLMRIKKNGCESNTPR